jgi:DNA-binding HxlR family transcriptional regulator
VDWQNLRDQLAPLRTRWDLAVLANLADSDGPVRPADLIKAINTQSSDGRHISWKVLEARLRSLETAGYVGRREMSHVPRETRYWLLARGHRLISALKLLDTWYSQEDPGTEGDVPSAYTLSEE